MLRYCSLLIDIVRWLCTVSSAVADRPVHDVRPSIRLCTAALSLIMSTCTQHCRFDLPKCCKVINPTDSVGHRISLPHRASSLAHYSTVLRRLRADSRFLCCFISLSLILHVYPSKLDGANIDLTGNNMFFSCGESLKATRWTRRCGRCCFRQFKIV